jgi:hypothetical protein
LRCAHFFIQLIIAGVGQPLIRVSWTKLAVSTAKRMPEPGRSAVLGALDTLRAEVREAATLDWRPAAFFVTVAENIAAALGRPGGRDFWRDVLLEAFERRLLQPLVRGALVIHGRTPKSILRMTPQAYSLSFKSCGDVSLHDTGASNRVRLQFARLPPVLRESDATMDCFAGNCDAAIRYLGMRGTVKRHDDDLAQGRLHYLVEWEA